jgi:hypothetical protein
MTSRYFCYWLQGYFELRKAGNSTGGIDKNQVKMIEKHLSLVFKHEIDPSMGDKFEQDKLNEIHGSALDGTLYRC